MGAEQNFNYLCVCVFGSVNNIWRHIIKGVFKMIFFCSLAAAVDYFKKTTVCLQIFDLLAALYT